MKVTDQKTEDRQAFLTIEIESEEMEESSASVYRRLVKRVNVPGFRKGKAPRPVLERHIGRERLLDEVVDDAVPKAFEKALQEQEIEAYGRPRIEVVQTDPVIFKAIVPLRPEVTLGDYRQVRLEPEPVAVAEEAVDAVVEQLRHQRGTWEPVERPLEMGDLASLDVQSTIDGEPYINQEGAQYRTEAEGQSPAPGFAEKIVGMSKDEQREFQIDFPEDHARTELAGKQASFKVRVTEIKREELPAVTDEFAAQVDAEFKTVDEMRARIRADLETRAEERQEAAFDERVIEAVVEVSQATYPPVLVEAEIQRMMDEQARRLQMQGLSMERYLQTANKTDEQLHEELHPEAEKLVSRSLILGKVAEQEKIEVSDADIDAEVADMIARAADDRKADMERVLRAPEARDSIRQRLLSRKTVQRIVDIARGLEPPAASEGALDQALATASERASDEASEKALEKTSQKEEG